MRIEIWSDVVCPWCYIGKRRLERALAGFTARHPEAEVDVRWRSFQLDPGAPTTPEETVAEHLGRKYGGGAAAGQQMVDRVEAVAAEEGLVYRLGQAQRVGTGDAHRLLHAAAAVSPQVQADLEEALFAAYFLEARNVADHDELVAIAAGAGLPAETAREVLAGDRYAEEVQADVRQAAAYGASGVPFFVLDERYGVSGAQPVEVFDRALERAWAERPRLVDVSAGQEGADGGVCGPDGCAV